MRFDPEEALQAWGAASERMLVRSCIGYRSRTSESIMAETGGEIIHSTRKRDYSPGHTLPRYALKIDRILREQPEEFRRLAEQRYIMGASVNAIADTFGCKAAQVYSDLKVLRHRVDAGWRVLRYR